MTSGAVSLGGGLALITSGAVLLLLALRTESERLPPVAPLLATPPASAAPIASCAPCPTCSAAPATTASAPVPATSASSLPDAGVLDAGQADAGDAGATSDGGAEAGAPASGDTQAFRFVPNDISLAKDELPRLLAFCRPFIRDGRGKIIVEGFGDTLGTDDKAVGLARRRDSLIRQTLISVSVDPERINIILPSPDADASLAGTVRLRIVMDGKVQ